MREVLSPEQRMKMETSSDSLFYSIPRIVTHVVGADGTTSSQGRVGVETYHVLKLMSEKQWFKPFCLL